MHHPNVVAIYGAEQVENRIGLWMEFVRGRAVEEALQEGRVFIVAEAVHIAVELCQAVAAVHGAGLLELTLMRCRLVEGIEAKAQRGEYRITVPVGYLWTRETGLEMDPDRRRAGRHPHRLSAV